METEKTIQKLHEYLMNEKKTITQGAEVGSDISYKWVVQNQELQIIEQGLPIFNFQQNMSQRKLDIEYRVLRRLTESQYHSQELKEYDPEVSKMNRYSNIIPYIHSEVQIHGDLANLNNNYINANYINSSLGDKHVMIATQGPLPNTIESLYRMLVQERVGTIIMLCNLKDGEKIQCDQYWPDSNKKTININKVLDLELQSEQEVQQGLLQRIINISVMDQNGNQHKHQVTQLHWTQWPDHGVPDQSNNHVMEYLIQRMIDNYLEKQKVVVHCSAGIGRTGTLCSLFNLSLVMHKHLVELQQNPNVNRDGLQLSVFGTVRRMREQRWGVLTADSQYAYVYNFINMQLKKNLARFI